MLLTIGYALLALAAILVCVNATSLYLEQKRLDGLADAAALAGADGFELTLDGSAVRAELESSAVREQAQALVDDVGEGAALISAETTDGVSARVTVRGRWHPPLLSLFVPEGVVLESTATARTALR